MSARGESAHQSVTYRLRTASMRIGGRVIRGP
nr:MAG TPA: hypothetical protein [Caudoviricetes sp.]